MKILLCTFEWNKKVRMRVKILDILFCKTDDYNAVTNLLA